MSLTSRTNFRFQLHPVLSKNTHRCTQLYEICYNIVYPPEMVLGSWKLGSMRGIESKTIYFRVTACVREALGLLQKWDRCWRKIQIAFCSC
jgi:hypothetical protein